MDAEDHMPHKMLLARRTLHRQLELEHQQHHRMLMARLSIIQEGTSLEEEVVSSLDSNVDVVGVDSFRITIVGVELPGEVSEGEEEDLLLRRSHRNQARRCFLNLLRSLSIVYSPVSLCGYYSL